MIMMISKQLLTLVQVVVISSIVNKNEVSAKIPDLGNLWDLVRGYLIPDFQKGGLVLPGKQQFAVVALLPNTRWLDFRYDPSPNDDGQKTIIDPKSPYTPPNPSSYGNYLAARPDKGVHAEVLILGHLDDLGIAYEASENKCPKALFLYSWIVPCKSCTDETLTREYDDIPTKIVAYTTNGGASCSDWDVSYTENVLIRAGIEVTQVYSYDELMEIANSMALLMQG